MSESTHPVTLFTGQWADLTFEEVAKYLKRSGKKVQPGVRALVVPGSQKVRDRLIAAIRREVAFG